MTLQQLIPLVLKTSIVLTVFGFGLQASVSDALHVARRPSLLGRSLLAMLVIMPILAIALARAFELRPSVEIALVALSISPIPPLLPGKGKKAGGHGAYALGLMVIVALLAIVTVPASVELLGRYLGRSFDLSSAAIAKVVLTTAILPLAVGMVFRAAAPAVAARIAKPVDLVAKVLLLGGVLALLAGTYRSLLALVGNGTLAAMAGFVVAGLAVGHLLGGPAADHRLVLAIATASRHPAIALTVAKVNFPDEPNLGATILLYLLVNAIVGIPYQKWQQRRAAAT